MRTVFGGLGDFEKENGNSDLLEKIQKKNATQSEEEKCLCEDGSDVKSSMVLLCRRFKLDVCVHLCIACGDLVLMVTIRKVCRIYK